ncbi:MAG: hypothetical protein J2P17_33345, partial [Mycobacterium sp.]|nr:hypothetical protein [Mycobacterium sp.]
MSLSAIVRRTVVAGSALAFLGGVVGTSVAAAASPTYYAFGGSGYGSTASLGTLVKSGPTSVVAVCSLKDVTKTNSAAATNLGALGNVGAVQSTTTGTSPSSTTRISTTTTSTASVSLLSGIIQGSAITSKAVAEHSSAGYTLTGSSTLTGLKIAGIPISVSPAKNTKISLPANLGTVILNHQTSGTNKYGTHQVAVDALYITVNSGNLLGLPAGRVVVGHAGASLHDPVHARPTGSAYVSKIQVAGGLVSSGPTAISSLPCAGSNSVTVSNTTAQVSVPGVATIGAAGSSAASTDTDTATTVHTSANVANVSLLGGIIQA